MNGLQIFKYQSNEVRMIWQGDEPWWILRDICSVLELSNSRMIADRLDEDDVSQTYITDNLGRQQQTNIINESGLYDVILRSDKPEARKFKRWITHEILPSIRKTGSYTIKKEKQPRPKPVDLIFRQRLNMARDFSRVTGVPLDIACAKAIDDAERITGEDFTQWKLSLPARSVSLPIPHLNATGLGELTGFNAQDVNKRLEAAGLQTKAGKSWRLTDAGKQYGEEYPFERNGHSDYRILWRDSAAEIVKATPYEE